MENETFENPKENTETPVQPAKREKTADEMGLSIYGYIRDIAYLLAGMIIVFLMLFRVVVVSGASMYQTLMDGDYLLLVNRHFCSAPAQGDVVVASKTDFRGGDPIIKRVIATQGQTVDIDFYTGSVYVDGVLLNEPYIYGPTVNPEGMTFPLTVEEGHVFVMGDNRPNSKDSRDPEIGLIDTREIMGKAVFLIFPGDHYGEQQRNFGRIGAISHGE